MEHNLAAPVSNRLCRLVPAEKQLGYGQRLPRAALESLQRQAAGSRTVRRVQIMNRIQLTSILSILCLTALGRASDAFAQRPGGYRLLSNDDPEPVSAAKFAVGEKGRTFGKTIVLTSIVHAQRQVVSGVNYKLCLKVRVDGTSKRSEAVVYRNLQKQYSLTSWTWGQCTKPPSAMEAGATPQPGQSSLSPSQSPARASEAGVSHVTGPTSAR